MAAKWLEAITGSLEQKKQYRQAKARVEALPEPYATAAEAVNRYLMHVGGVVEGDVIVRMFVDLVDLWEQAAADGKLVSDIVGDDPVAFAENWAEAYGGKRWIDKERTRLVRTFDELEKGEQP